MKEMLKKIKEKDIDIFVFLLVTITVIAFERTLSAYDELWNFSNTYKMTMENVPKRTYNLSERIASRKPKDIAYTGDKGIKLVDVADGKATMEQFVAQISTEDLCAMVKGEGMNSPKVTAGTGGAFGGITDSLIDLGIPVVCCTDGPSGIRMDSGAKATAMPNGTCLACTFNDELVERMYD